MSYRSSLPKTIYLVSVLCSILSYVVLHCPMRGTLWDIVGFRRTHVTCPKVAFRQAYRITCPGGVASSIGPEGADLLDAPSGMNPVILLLHILPVSLQGS